jgi:AraC-like DNA-binding protein
MPSSSVQTFADPDEYTAAMRGATQDVTVSKGGRFRAHITRVRLANLWMHSFTESLPRTSHGAMWGDRVGFEFRPDAGPDLSSSGVRVVPTNIVVYKPGEEFFEHSSGPISWSSMSLPASVIASVGEALIGLDLMSPTDCPLEIRPLPDAMAPLKRLHAAAIELAASAPTVLAHPEAARSLEQAVIEVLLQCFSSGNRQEDRAAMRQHAEIMRRFHRVIEEHLDEPLYIPELCREIGASVRTLNTCCHEHLGMGPKHYLLLRRMHMVRRALRQSATADTNVTEVATRYGFWQLGRLAVEYKTLFGESPSDTLARVE